MCSVEFIILSRNRIDCQPYYWRNNDEIFSCALLHSNSLLGNREAKKIHFFTEDKRTIYVFFISSLISSYLFFLVLDIYIYILNKVRSYGK